MSSIFFLLQGRFSGRSRRSQLARHVPTARRSCAALECKRRAFTATEFTSDSNGFHLQQWRLQLSHALGVDDFHFGRAAAPVPQRKSRVSRLASRARAFHAVRSVFQLLISNYECSIYCAVLFPDGTSLIARVCSAYRRRSWAFHSNWDYMTCTSVCCCLAFLRITLESAHWSHSELPATFSTVFLLLK